MITDRAHELERRGDSRVVAMCCARPLARGCTSRGSNAWDLGSTRPRDGQTCRVEIRGVKRKRVDRRSGRRRVDRDLWSDPQGRHPRLSRFRPTWAAETRDHGALRLAQEMGRRSLGPVLPTLALAALRSPPSAGGASQALLHPCEGDSFLTVARREREPRSAEPGTTATRDASRWRLDGTKAAFRSKDLGQILVTAPHGRRFCRGVPNDDTHPASRSTRRARRIASAGERAVRRRAVEAGDVLSSGT